MLLLSPAKGMRAIPGLDYLRFTEILLRFAVIGRKELMVLRQRAGRDK
jgi:hypothetical protein